MEPTFVQKEKEIGATDYISLLNKISRNINSTGEQLEEAILSIKDELVDGFSVDAVAIWTKEGETKFLKIEASFGLSERFIRFFNKTDRVSVGLGLVGKVITERKTICIPTLEAYAKIGVLRWNEMLKEEGFRAILAAPIFVGEETIGSFNVYFKKEKNFSKDEERFMEIIANHVAVAIANISRAKFINENSERLKEELANMAQVQEVTQGLSRLLYSSPDFILSHLGDYLAGKVKAKCLALYELEKESKIFQLSGSSKMSAELKSFHQSSPIRLEEKTLVGLAFNQAEPQISERVFTDERIIKHWSVALSNEHYMAMGAYPLMVEKRVVGVLGIFYDYLHETSAGEKNILNTFSQFLAVAIENLNTFSTLVSEKQKTKSMVYSLQDGLLVHDLKNVIMEVNPKALEILMMQKEDLLGKETAGLLLDNDPKSRLVGELINYQINDFENKEYTLGEPFNRYLRIVQVPLTDEENRKIGSMRILHDITKEKKVEHIKSNFVSTASHQLRTPLTGIKWGLDALLKDEHLTADQREILTKIFTVNENVIGLINDLLNVSKIEENEFEYQFAETELLPMIEKIVRELKVVSDQRKVLIFIEPTSEILPKVTADLTRLDLAFRNLIDNAIKYTPAGKKVTIRFHAGRESLVVAIEDEGIGIPKKDQEFLFNKFFRARNATKEQADGSGLGLYIAKSIIDKHNGAITVDSVEEKGTTFFVQLPTTPERRPKIFQTKISASSA